MLNTPALRTDVPLPLEIVGQEKVSEFVGMGMYVVVAASKSTDSVWVVDPLWIIKVSQVNKIDMQNESVDSFGFRIAPKVWHLEGSLLEKNDKMC